MDVGETLYVTTRKQWRAWLRKHHASKAEIWLVYYRKASGKPRIPYNDSVEEALCYGWIDSNQKGIDTERFAQRFTPRRRVGGFSEMNKQRVRRLMAQGKMTRAGLAVVGDALDGEPLVLAPDVERALREDPQAWKHYRAFPESYRRVRIAYVEAGRRREGEFERRLRHFVRMTTKNKRFGFVREFR